MKLKGKRTLIFAGVAALLPMLDALREVLSIVLSSPEFGAIVPREFYPYYALSVTVGAAILRVYTTTPVGRDE